MSWIDQVKFDANGLVPVIAQDVFTNKVLMFAWMNRESLTLTVQEKQAVYWSRSRAKLWRKGEESGHTQAVREIRLDCDNDVVLLKIVQKDGIACHTGRESCFFHRLDDRQWNIVESLDDLAAQAEISSPVHARLNGHHSPDLLELLADVLESRKSSDPDKSYVARLFAKGPDALLKKIGEEATELVMAAKDQDPAKIIAETADLWFHSMVALSHFGLRPADVIAELKRREGLSGLDEKAARKDQQRGIDEKGVS
jgi:phosphoribosyl-AMP cyclohydrolase / phosphoribosyl-ATP pyrophosphohydrolase